MRVAILLAAGGSRRFGMSNKLFARWGRMTLLERTMRIASQAPVQRLVVVVGSQAGRVAAAARHYRRDALVVRARAHQEGLGASLRAASRHLRPVDREIFVFLADMPWVRPETARALLRIAAPRGMAVRPSYRGRPGHPVLLRQAVSSLNGLRGDEGPARGAMGRVRLVRAGRGCVADVDKPAALFRAVPRLR